MSRFARTRGPFAAAELEGRYRLAGTVTKRVLKDLEIAGRVLEGEFRPGKTGKEWIDANVLRTLRQRSLAKLRHQIEPVDHSAFGRFLPVWHRIGVERESPEAILEVIAQIQGYPIPASVLEDQVMRARVHDYDPHDLDALMASGLVVWAGVDALGTTDGRIALYLTESAATLLPDRLPPPVDDVHQRIRDYLASAGASFFPQIVQGIGGGFRAEALNALWDLVWSGEVTNDTLSPLRAFLERKTTDRRRTTEHARNSGRSAPVPESVGRWSLLSKMFAAPPPAVRMAAVSRQLLDRLGVVTRESVTAERFAGGFSALYPVFKAMEESGKIRRGYFIAGRGAAQFADPGAIERLRAFRSAPDDPSIVMLAATDPANPYGAALPWPSRKDNRQAGRVAGAQVILVDGELAAYFSKTEKSLLTFFDADDPRADRFAEGVVRALAGLVTSGLRRAVLITEVDGTNPARSVLSTALENAGFRAGLQGWQRRASD